MEFLQDVDDTEDAVIETLIENLTNPNAKIRLAVVESLAPVPIAIQALINRIKDVDETVRIAICKKMASIPSQSLTVSIQLLQKTILQSL